ncbi:MAG: tRNA pseudouridine(54/55) synthase Pus10 [Candidatus Atabeyarchaeum deiterrae]
MEITEIASRLLERYPLCDHCLGRQFALLGVDLDNEIRGRSLKNVLAMRYQSFIESNNASEEMIRDLRILATNGNYKPALKILKKIGVIEEDSSRKCFICSNVLDNLDELAKKAAESLTRFEFKTFLVGSVVPPEVSELEDEVRSGTGSNWCESLKREINREIGKRLRKLAEKEPDFDSPDLTLSIDPFKQEIAVKPNPLFISGRYKKLVRGIPQATWLCRKCRGTGCADCNWTGRTYQYSVQEFISKPFLEETGGLDCKFHGAGREDVDARMLGSGRPFIIEVKEPKKRFIDLPMICDRIMKYSDGRVVVSGLKTSSREDLRRIKSMATATEKTYEAIISIEREVGDGDVKKLLAKLSGATISQRTPLRVLHRRADRIRFKKVHDLQINLTAPREMVATIRCQGGLYVKELVTGDSGRTMPSFSEVLQARAECSELDVIDVADQFI